MIETLIKFVLNNRLLIAVAAVCVMAAGFYGYKKLPIDAFPDVSPNLVQVFTVTEGLAPEEVEKYVTYPVEAAMTGLPGVRNLRSVSNFGLSVVNVYFEDGMDIYFARQLVGERLTEARGQIPEGFGEPEMGPISTGMGLILFYYLEDETGTRSLEELRSLQDWVVKFHLQTVPGVTEVLGIGGWEKQFHVNVDPDALLRYDVTLAEVIAAVKANNLNVGAQFIEKNAEQYIVRSVGLATSIEDLENIVVKAEDGTPVFLRHIADVEIGGAVRRGLQTKDGLREVVAGMVVKLFGANSSTVITATEQKLAEINEILPKGVKVNAYYQQKTLVEACIATVTHALLGGIILVSLVLVVFLGAFRPTLVMAVSIPFSVLFALLGMKVFGISANLMSFGGLAIAIGMMVDGTVVIVENVDRMLRKSGPNESRVSIIQAACLEVIRPIAFAVFIIIVVFLPLFTLQGVEGKMFRPLAYTVSLGMFGSLLFTIFVAPILANLLMRRPKRTESATGHRDVLIVRTLKCLYVPVVRCFVAHRSFAVTISVIIICIGAAIFPRLGSEFTPTLQEGTLVVRLSMAPSISLNESKRVTMTVERRLTKIPEIAKVVTRIGRGEVGAHADPINNAEAYVILKPRKEWRVSNQEQLANLIRKEIGDVPGVLVSLTQPIAMSIDELLEGVRAELAIKLFGDDIDVLLEKANEIAAVVSRVPGAADIQVDQVTGTPQLLIRVDRQSIARYGINVEDVQNVIRAAVGGEESGQIFEGVRRYDIVTRFQPEFRSDPEAIGNILIRAPGGANVPLAQLAEIREVVGPRQITRENTQRFISVQCNVTGRDIGSFVEEGQAAIEEEIDLPAGYLVTWGGQFRLQQEANKRLAVVIPITLGAVFFLLFYSFDSLRKTLLIFLNIPLALVGGVVGLWVSGQNLSVPASVGFIALFGIALLNGIVLVTYLNQLVREGLPVDEASVQGAVQRLRPVLMTALTTLLALIPLLFSSGVGSEVQRPLATVVVGGLFTSTVLTLLVIPALYKWFSAPVSQDEKAER